MTGRFLTADFGSSSIRLAVIDAEGHVAHEVKRAFTDTASVRHRLAPEWLWTQFVRLVQSLPASARDVSGIGLSGQLSVVLTGGDGKPLIELSTHADQTACVEADQLREGLGDLLAITGRRASPELAAPRLLWLRAHRPNIFTDVRHVSTLKDYFVHRLTGEWATDETSASYTLLYDVFERRWSDELLAACELDPGSLPGVSRAGDKAGILSGEVASVLGLPKGIVVAVGASDGCAGAVGAGAVAPGIVVDVAGTTDVLMHALDRPPHVPESPVVVNAFIQGLWTAGGPTGITGGVTSWLATLLGCASVEELYARWGQLVDEQPPGADGLVFVTTLAGDRFPGWRPERGATLHGLGMDHTPAALIRAAEEGSACLVAAGLTALADVGLGTHELRVVGGTARSRRAMRLRADVCGVPVSTMENHEASALGAAMCAAVATRTYVDFEEAAAHMVRVAETIDPDPDGVRQMADVFARWRSVWQA